MIAIEDIEDGDSLRQWLDEWLNDNKLDDAASQTLKAAIAYRVAMRVAPLWWEWVVTSHMAHQDYNTPLPVMRAALISGIVARRPTPANKHAAAITADAAFAAQSVILADKRAPSLMTNAQKAAYKAAYTVHESRAVTNSYNVGELVDDASQIVVAGTLFEQIRADCATISDHEDVFSKPLWSARNNLLEISWRKTKARITGPEWSFWIKWYDDALAGNPPNWKMQEAIALIESDVWGAGAEAVAEEIARIQMGYAVQATPNAEDIRINENDKYQAFPRSTLPVQTLRDARDRVSDVIRLIREAQERTNQYTALIPEAELLEDALKRYGNNALRIYEACYKVVRHVVRHVTDGVLPESDNLVGDVSGDLQNTGDDIYNFDEEVRKTVDARAKLRFGRLNEQEKAQIKAVAIAVAAQSEESLAEELNEDAQVIEREANPSEETLENRFRLGSRLLKVVAIGGAGLVVITTVLSQMEGAVTGAKYLWEIIRPLLGL